MVELSMSATRRQGAHGSVHLSTSDISAPSDLLPFSRPPSPRHCITARTITATATTVTTSPTAISAHEVAWSVSHGNTEGGSQPLNIFFKRQEKAKGKEEKYLWLFFSLEFDPKKIANLFIGRSEE